jgi:hypothetical protein
VRKLAGQPGGVGREASERGLESSGIEQVGTRDCAVAVWSSFVLGDGGARRWRTGSSTLAVEAELRT